MSGGRSWAQASQTCHVGLARCPSMADASVQAVLVISPLLSHPVVTPPEEILQGGSRQLRVGLLNESRGSGVQKPKQRRV